MKKYKHKKLGWIAEENIVFKTYSINKLDYGRQLYIHKELVEDSQDREEIKEKQAQSFDKKFKAYKNIKKRQFLNDNGWVPDWENFTQHKRHVKLDISNNKLVPIYDDAYKSSLQIEYSSSIKVMRVIKELEKEYKILLDIN